MDLSPGSPHYNIKSHAPQLTSFPNALMHSGKSHRSASQADIHWDKTSKNPALSNVKAVQTSDAKRIMQVAVFACTTPRTLQQGLISLYVSPDGGESWTQADGLLSIYSPNTSAALAPYNGSAPWPNNMLSPQSNTLEAKLPCVLSAIYTSTSSAISVACSLDTVSFHIAFLSFLL